MKPPIVAQAIIAIVTTPRDYESVSGDLQEEYVFKVRREGRAHANRWYWAQVVGSIPSLLSYARTSSSIIGTFVTGVIVLFSIVGMLSANEFMDDVVHGLCRVCGGAGWTFFAVGWLDAALFGAFIAAARVAYGIRLIIISGIAFLAFLAIPIALRISAPLSIATWILALGGAVSMNIGGGGYHFVRLRRRERTSR